MVGDDERRDVARRLRSFVTDDSVYADVDACRVLHSIGLYYKDVDRIYFSGFDVARLADLIEPDHVGDSNKMVDRDALLALAEELENNDVTYLVSTQYVLDSYADRIRKALGVSQ